MDNQLAQRQKNLKYQYSETIKLKLGNDCLPIRFNSTE